MYKYKIGYTTCEENSFVELEHEKKLTNEDITQMVAEAIEALFLDKINEDAKDKKGFYYAHSFKFDEFWRDGFSQTNIVDWLIKNRGFKNIEYELTWMVFGWASVLDKSDWKGHRGQNDDLAKITDSLNKMGLKKEDFPLENWKK